MNSIKLFNLVIILSFLSLFTKQKDWVLSDGVTVPTIYYQGMLESQTQCSRYTGKRGFLATTGEWVVCKRSIDTIYMPYIGCEIDEVTPQKPLKKLFKKWWRLGNVVTCIHYGLNQMRNKSRDIKVISRGKPANQNSITGHSIDISKVNIAQRGDVKNHKRKYEKLVTEYGKGYPVILYGVSRGAATTFSAIAMNQYENVRLVVLEGCFDSLDGLAPARWPWLYKIGGFSLASCLLEDVTSYKRSGVSPISNVTKFPQDVPVLFITSKIDKTVPYICTERLAKALVKAGHQQVYFLPLSNSSHVGYMCDDKDDKALYEKIVHALYQKLNLPYIPFFAERGKDILEQYHLKNA